MTEWQPMDTAPKDRPMLIQMKGLRFLALVGEWGKPIIGRADWFCPRSGERIPRGTGWMDIPK